LNPSSANSLARTNYVASLGDGIVGADTGDLNNETTRGPFPRAQQLTLAAVTDGTSNTIMFGEIATIASANLADHTISVNPTIQGRSIEGVLVQAVQGSGGGSFNSVNVLDCKARTRGGIYPTTGSMTRFGTTTGTNWLRAGTAWNGFMTIIGPNGANCYTGVGPAGTTWPAQSSQSIRTAGSYHFGGAHVVTFDNSVKFVPNEIDTANSNPGALPADYVAPCRGVVSGVWDQTTNWNSPSPFGVWGALGTRGAGDDVGVMPGA